MNLLLWIIQIVLALFRPRRRRLQAVCLRGAGEDARKQLALPQSAWGALGVFEMVCGVLLIVPFALKWMPALTPLAAAALVLESLALAALYAWFSLQLAPSNPLVWVVLMAILAALIACGRYAR